MIKYAMAFALMTTPLAAQTPAEWDKVIEAAKREGEVTFNSGHVGVPYHKEVGKRFEQKYGIKVNILDLRASEQTERIRIEKATNRVVADVIYTGGTMTPGYVTAGFLAPTGALPSLPRLKAQFLGDDYAIPVWSQVYAMLIAARIPESARPISWLDLHDAK